MIKGYIHSNVKENLNFFPLIERTGLIGQQKQIIFEINLLYLLIIVTIIRINKHKNT